MRARVLRALTIVNVLVFLAACLENFGLRLTAGPLDLYFSAPVWQAGVGEGVIGVVLLAAALRDRVNLYWIAYGLSVLGILFGLSSARVVGAAREIHIVLVPLAAVGLALLISEHARGGGTRPEPRTP
jgi:hypothetical protein